MFYSKLYLTKFNLLNQFFKGEKNYRLLSTYKTIHKEIKIYENRNEKTTQRL